MAVICGIDYPARSNFPFTFLTGLFGVGDLGTVPSSPHRQRIGRCQLSHPQGQAQHVHLVKDHSGAEAMFGATEGLRNRSALEAMANGEDAEEIARIWDEAQQDLANGAVASVDNLVEWVSTAREGFNNKPRHLLVLLRRGCKVSAYQAPADALR